MPIIERDPWRVQYFRDVECPGDVVIPTDDEHAYELFPRHRWIYNKLLICDSQGIPAAPHGVVPPDFPVFSKPIYNMHGMGVDGRIMERAADLDWGLRAGHMWMELLRGEHMSTDVVLVDGEARWWRHSVGRALGGGTFDYWTVLGDDRPDLEAYCGAWLRRHLNDYTGAVNLETIGGRIIEAHLRFTDQWPDLYGPGWIEAIVGLYAVRSWRRQEEDRRTGYSVVLFGPHGVAYRPPPRALVTALVSLPEISSVQVTFHRRLAPELHAMPPGGFRLAVVNCWDLEAGLRAREELARCFRVHTGSEVREQVRQLRKAS